MGLKRKWGPSMPGYRQMRSHEEQQIHDAFIDGYLSGSGASIADAERAWSTENVTSKADFAVPRFGGPDV